MTNQAPKGRLYKIFNWIYIGNLAIMAIAMLISIAFGLHEDNNLTGILNGIGFALFFSMPPLTTLFLILNVIRLFITNSHRALFIALTVLLTIWNIWVWYKINTIPFP